MDTIRLHYKWWKLRFLNNNTVMAQKTPGGAWGVLYTPRMTMDHLREITP
jgi:hypothetical protein